MQMKKHLAAPAVAVLLGLGAAWLVFRGDGAREQGRETGPPSRQPGRTPAAASSQAPALRTPVFASNTSSDLAADEATPGSPAYRPQKYLMAIGVKGIFEREARDEPWAAPMEKHLSAAISRDLAAMLRVDPSAVSMECRTTACRMSLSAEVDMARVQELMRVLYLSNGGSTDPATRTHYFLFSGTVFDPHGDPAHTIARSSGGER